MFDIAALQIGMMTYRKLSTIFFGDKNRGWVNIADASVRFARLCRWDAPQGAHRLI
jgi:hypothetical protein